MTRNETVLQPTLTMKVLQADAERGREDQRAPGVYPVVEVIGSELPLFLATIFTGTLSGIVLGLILS